MTKEEKIAGAAEILKSEYAKRGHYITMPHAVALAQKLYQYWVRSVRCGCVSFTLEGTKLTKFIAACPNEGCFVKELQHGYPDIV